MAEIVLPWRTSKGRVLGAEDGHAVLAVFAQSGATVEARERGADVVRTNQQKDCWFRCDCLETGPAPTLIPVTETHIRRSPHHPDHAEGCLLAQSPHRLKNGQLKERNVDTMSAS